MHGVRTNGLKASPNSSEGLWSVPDARRPHKQGRRNIQRNEFQVTVNRRHPEVMDSNNLARKEDKPRTSMDQGAKKDLGLSAENLMKSESSSKTGYGTSFTSVFHEEKVEKMPGSKLPQRSGLRMPRVMGSHSAEGILKKMKNLKWKMMFLYKVVLYKFLSSLVREQRDKEMKAKSKDFKPKDQVDRRYRAPSKSTSQVDGTLENSQRVVTSSGGEKRNSMMPSTITIDSAQIDGKNLPNFGSSVALGTLAGPPQQLAPLVHQQGILRDLMIKDQYL